MSLLSVMSQITSMSHDMADGLVLMRGSLVQINKGKQAKIMVP